MRGRLVNLGFGAALLLLGLVGYLAYHNIAALLQNNADVRHSLDVLTSLKTLQSYLIDAETGQRGYLITANPIYLEPYNNALGGGVADSLARLKSLTANDPLLEGQMAELSEAIDLKLTLLKQTIDLRDSQGFVAAQAFVDTNRGKNAMDHIRRLVASLEGKETDLLAERDAQASQSANNTLLTLMAGGLVSVFLLLFVVTSFSRELRVRARTEKALEEAQAQQTQALTSLEARNQDFAALMRLSDHLQACQSHEEAYAVITDFAGQLFSAPAGILSIFRSSRNLLDLVTTWGVLDQQRDPQFAPEECWALRRGQLHISSPEHPGLACHHLGPVLHQTWLCVPLIAQGDTLGIIHLAYNQSDLVTANQENLVRVVAKQIGLALANLKLRETLRNQAIRDPLTGLFNRRYIEETLEREINRAGRNKTNMGVLMLDVDHFKKFNDTYGHSAGDTLLAQLGAFLASKIRGGDIACRYGGEEFTLILPDAPPAAIYARADEILAGVRSLVVAERGQSLGPISLSIGVAVFPDHGETGKGLLHTADMALYRAKEEGRDRVIVAEIAED